jgi:hypothetical protein
LPTLRDLIKIRRHEPACWTHPCPDHPTEWDDMH